MGGILQEPSTDQIVDAIERNGFEHIRAFARWPRAEVYDGADMLRVLTDLPDAAFNMVVRADVRRDAAEEAVRAVRAAAEERGVPVAWLVGPSSRPRDLGAHLLRNGFVHDGDAVGMAVGLDGIGQPAPHPGVRIEEIADNEALRAWCGTVAAGFALAPFTVAPLHEMLASLSPSPRSAFRAFLASDAGEPIAVASLYLAAGVAGIYNVATLPAARRRGIGTHLTDATLRAARSAGYRVAVLQATPEAIGVYRRLGFRPYCRLQSYGWAADG